MSKFFTPAVIPANAGIQSTPVIPANAGIQSVGADETTAKAETTALQGGRAQNALCAVADGDTPLIMNHDAGVFL